LPNLQRKSPCALYATKSGLLVPVNGINRNAVRSQHRDILAHRTDGRISRGWIYSGRTMPPAGRLYPAGSDAGNRGHRRLSTPRSRGGLRLVDGATHLADSCYGDDVWACVSAVSAPMCVNTHTRAQPRRRHRLTSLCRVHTRTKRKKCAPVYACALPRAGTRTSKPSVPRRALARRY
jgi:hypothetical protein